MTCSVVHCNDEIIEVHTKWVPRTEFIFYGVPLISLFTHTHRYIYIFPTFVAVHALEIMFEVKG